MIERNSETITLKTLLVSRIAVILELADEFRSIRFLANDEMIKTITVAIVTATTTSAMVNPLFFFIF